MYKYHDFGYHHNDDDCNDNTLFSSNSNNCYDYDNISAVFFNLAWSPILGVAGFTSSSRK